MTPAAITVRSAVSATWTRARNARRRAQRSSGHSKVLVVRCRPRQCRQRHGCESKTAWTSKSTSGRGNWAPAREAVGSTALVVSVDRGFQGLELRLLGTFWTGPGGGTALAVVPMIWELIGRVRAAAGLGSRLLSAELKPRSPPGSTIADASFRFPACPHLASKPLLFPLPPPAALPSSGTDTAASAQTLPGT